MKKKDIVNKTGKQIKLSTACLPMKSELNFFALARSKSLATQILKSKKKKKRADSLPAISDFIKGPLEVKYCDFFYDFAFMLFCDVNISSKMVIHNTAICQYLKGCSKN